MASEVLSEFLTLKIVKLKTVIVLGIWNTLL
jgi:hypothetical protein